MRIDELMTRDVLSVTPRTPLKRVAELLAERRISGLPVCGPDGEVLGVVSEADVLWKERGPAPKAGLLGRLLDTSDEERARVQARTAGEAMTSPAITIRPGATAAQAARLMLEYKINRLPVVDGRALVGIVTRADLVRAFARSDEEIGRELVEDVILHTLWLSPESVHVAVKGGEVMLTGAVENRSSAELLMAYARRVPGVVGVRSALTWTTDDLARRMRAGV